MTDEKKTETGQSKTETGPSKTETGQSEAEADVSETMTDGATKVYSSSENFWQDFRNFSTDAEMSNKATLTRLEDGFESILGNLLELINVNATDIKLLKELGLPNHIKDTNAAVALLLERTTKLESSGSAVAGHRPPKEIRDLKPDEIDGIKKLLESNTVTPASFGADNPKNDEFDEFDKLLVEGKLDEDGKPKQ